MGNRIARENKKAKIMKIDGQMLKIKMPARATDVLKDYPSGHVLLESQAVKRYGIRAPELRPQEELKAGKIYFLIEMPKFPEGTSKERLESLMMLRDNSRIGAGPGSGPVRVKMRIPKAEIEKVMEESKDEGEVVDRILDFCLQNSTNYI